MVSSCVVKTSCTLSASCASINSFRKCSVSLGWRLLSSSSTTKATSSLLLISMSIRSNSLFVPSDSSSKLKSNTDFPCFKTSVVISGSPTPVIRILKKPSAILHVIFNSGRFVICICFFNVLKISDSTSLGSIWLISSTVICFDLTDTGVKGFD